MKRFGLMLLAALLATVPGYGGAQAPGPMAPPPAPPTQGPEVKAPAPPAAKSFTPKERQEYQKKIAADLAKLEEKIDGLKDQQAKPPPQMRRTILRSRVNLQRLDAIARGKLAALQKASEKDWHTLKAEMDKALEDLKKTYEAAEAQFR